MQRRLRNKAKKAVARWFNTPTNMNTLFWAKTWTSLMLKNFPHDQDSAIEYTLIFSRRVVKKEMYV